MIKLTDISCTFRQLLSKKSTLKFALILAPVALFSSCIDENLPDCDVPQNGEFPSEYMMRFTIQLPTLGNSTRAVNDVEAYENYIDPSKLNILIFTQEHPSDVIPGKTHDPKQDEDSDTDLDVDDSETSSEDDPYYLYKRFTPSDKEVSLIPVAYETNDNYEKSWYVNISVTNMSDGSGEEFAKKLRTHRFRVAVLANADNSKIKIEEKDDINVLHHQTAGTEDQYSKSSDAKNTYKFLWNLSEDRTKYGVLGNYTNWVQTRSKTGVSFEDENEAREWIRKNWNPDGSTKIYDTNNPEHYDNTDPYCYSELWNLWNFGGNIADNANPYSFVRSDFDDIARDWETRNGSVLRSWITTAGDGNVLPDLKEEAFTSPTETNPLTFKKNDNATAIYKDENGKKLYGVTLPVIEPTGTNGRLDFSKNPGYFKFRAHATGYIFLKVRHPGNPSTSDIKLRVQTGNSNDMKDFSIKYYTDNTKQEINGIQTISAKISITSNEQDVYIYNYIDKKGTTSGNGRNTPVEIYEIEFVEDKYLYDTNREGIAPSKEQPIPMFGVQTYGAIGNLWPKGTTFDLNNYNIISSDYPEEFFGNEDYQSYFHPLPLLRSVAKVVVRIPKALHPHHVYLRCVNRYGRWEPADIQKDTHKIWADGNPDIPGHPQDCEFFDIMKQPVFYNPDQTTVTNDEGEPIEQPSQLQNYQRKLAWYYGTWADASGQVGGITPVESASKREGFDYPHIMNPLITRSDFVEFLYAGEDNIYDKYVLYVGEKFVDDPDSADLGKDMETSIPKVCHVEFRTNDDPHSNLDDENCYRIYFAPGGFAGTDYPTLEDNDHRWEKSYEQKVDILQKHYPIIRNHAYEFTVSDVSQKVVIVKLEVLPWKRVDDITVSW